MEKNLVVGEVVYDKKSCSQKFDKSLESSMKKAKR